MIKYLPKGFSVDYFKGCYIAGGAILSALTKKEIADYDIYPKTKEALLDAVAQIIDDSDTFIVNVTDRAITFKMNSDTLDNGKRVIGQIMTYDTFETPEKIFENFDFTVCMAAFDTDTSEYTFHEAFFPDVASKTIRFNPKTRYPLNSILRITKYREKGYYVSKPELTRMILTAAAKGIPQSWEELETQIGGTYGREIKIQSEGKEYSFEAALELLENMSWFNMEDMAEDFTKVNMDHFDVALQPEKWRIYTIENDTAKFGGYDKILYNVETKAVHEFDKGFGILLDAMKVTIDPIEDGEVIGYKIIQTDKEGISRPVIRSNTKFVYNLEGETVEEKDPHLFFYTEKEHARGSWATPSLGSVVRYFTVKTKLSEIVKVEITQARTRVFTFEEEYTDKKFDTRK